MIEPTYLYNRRETVLMLATSLGTVYDWHSSLMMWTTKKMAGNSIQNCGIRLFPHSKAKQSPLYLPADVMEFIKNMQARFPEMARPFKIEPTLYNVETTPTPGFLKGQAYKFRKATPALPVVAV